MRLPKLFGILSLAAACLAHMEMSSPSPLGSRFNPNTSPGKVDYAYNSPLEPNGTNFPCKGHLDVLGTSDATPVETWEAGGNYSAIVMGDSPHGGGSCQIVVSIDGGSTFRVIHSYIGGCPVGKGDNPLNFTVPRDIPSTEDAIMAWTWFNNVGVREMYMNCAVVRIVGGGDGDRFNQRPTMFRANSANGCSTVDSKDTMFPNPGPDVDVNNRDAVLPKGDCETGPGATESARESDEDEDEDGGDDGAQGNGNNTGTAPEDENHGWAVRPGPQQVVVLVGVMFFSFVWCGDLL
ncbi:hypothetical protein CCHL11_07953 [Colletotrichum chlorophyti]|uniref:Extracellular protein n=1 Tax=Colletotrichum chlorophyti TaxID=708187 RepID=A0A1Q8S8H6_9PEZI|nr:hypothetical protein CCHL11_07953 [Colletotrichum chlorophyti]